MAEIVNLHRARRRKLREAALRAAEENRARHGRSKAERQRDEAAEALRRKLLDGARRDEDGG
ncbi:MAG: DUF4169 family protein [Acidisphaera sp.]|nr:DUF4169 family protein [Acidisphaera sp.]